MKGQIEVLGTNYGLSSFKGDKGEGSLVSVVKEHHCLMLGDEQFFYHIFRTILAEDHIEYVGWCSDKDSNVGRMGIKYRPTNYIL